jgi:hypothetical protein
MMRRPFHSVVPQCRAERHGVSRVPDPQVLGGKQASLLAFGTEACSGDLASRTPSGGAGTEYRCAAACGAPSSSSTSVRRPSSLLFILIPSITCDYLPIAF